MKQMAKMVAESFWPQYKFAKCSLQVASLKLKKTIWQLYVWVREVAPYATQNLILPPSTFKALKKILTSHQDQLYTPMTMWQFAGTALQQKQKNILLSLGSQLWNCTIFKKA